MIEPVRRFLAIEAASGVLLLVATVVALVWVNAGAEASYVEVWAWSPGWDWAGPLGGMDLHHLVNDGLMTVFFFVVGLEVKLEWTQGSLRDRRFARLPIAAAVGGMVLPAGLYLAITAGTSGTPGWGIPMATDIAFVAGIMALLSFRVPHAIRVFVLTLAIVDDLGAIVVIAVFYAEGVQAAWLAVAAVGLAAVLGLRRLGVQRISAYLLLGIPVWYATWQSGVHATIAGVALALCTPMQVRGRTQVWSPVGHLLERLHPWSSFVVMPVFALANAGVLLAVPDAPDAGRVVVGVVVGLVVGKTLGIVGVSWAMVRAGAASLPTGLVWGHVLGAALLAGIGFTMSLFITGLAFTDSGSTALDNAARQGILVASTVAALGGTVAFVATARRRRAIQAQVLAGEGAPGGQDPVGA